MTPGYTGDVTDKQSIFDFVWNFITEQGAPARSNDQCALLAPGCRYRIEGRACAAGCLVPDSDYTPGFDNAEGGGTGIMRDNGTASNYFREKGYDRDFLFQLQRCHDGAGPLAFVENFQSNMRELATRYTLIAPGE